MKKINLNSFKLSMSKFATGVTVITIKNKNQYLGKTVNSFASLSLNPSMVLFSLDKKSTSLKDYKNAKYIGINILADTQKNLSNHFSKKTPEWGETKYFLATHNTPMIKDSIANINCINFSTINQGDHLIFICKVIEVKIINNKKPLIYLNSKYI